jgi:hypothetical protein
MIKRLLLNVGGIPFLKFQEPYTVILTREAAIFRAKIGYFRFQGTQAKQKNEQQQ